MMIRAKLTKWNRLLTYFVLWNMLFSMMPTNLIFAQSTQIDYGTLEPSIPLDPNTINITISKDSQGQEIIDEEGIEWKLELNKAQTDLPMTTTDIRLSEKQVMSKLMGIEGAVKKVVAVHTDKTETVLYNQETMTSLSANDAGLISKNISHYRVDTEETNHPITLYFTSKYEDKESIDFQAIAVIRTETAKKTVAKTQAPSRETIDKKVTVNWKGLAQGEATPIASIHLTNPINGQVLSQTTSDSTIFEALPKYTDEHQEIDYQVSQDPIVGFQTTIDKDAVTNTKEKPTVTEAQTSSQKEPSSNSSSTTNSGTAEVSSNAVEESNPQNSSNSEAQVSSEPVANSESSLSSAAVVDVPATTRLRRSVSTVTNLLAARAATIPNPNTSSGTITDNVSSYTWTAQTASDGLSVQWTLKLSEKYTSGSTNAAAYIGFNLPNYFNTLSTNDITATFTRTAGSSTPIVYKLGSDRTFWVKTTQYPPATNIDLTVTFTTTLSAPYTATESMSIEFIPGVDVRSSTFYGPTNTAQQSSSSSQTKAPDSIRPLTITAYNPNFVSAINVTANAKDNNNLAIPNATVTLTATDGKTYQGTTNASGAAIIQAPAGTYTASASAIPGYTSPANKSVTISNTSTSFDMIYSKNLYPVNITVKDNNGAAVPTSQVTLTSVSDPTKIYTFNTGGGSATQSLPYGSYNVSANTVTGYTLDTYNKTLMVDSAKNITITYTKDVPKDPNLANFTNNIVSSGKYNPATKSIDWTVVVEKPVNGAGVTDQRYIETVLSVPSNSGLGPIGNFKVVGVSDTGQTTGTTVTRTSTASTTADKITYTFSTPITDAGDLAQNPSKTYTINTSATIKTQGGGVLVTKIQTPSVVVGVKLNTVTIRLVDAQDPNIQLAGGIFDIFDSKGTFLQRVTTAANGEVVVEGLPTDQTFTVKQVSTANGYIVAAQQTTVALAANTAALLTIQNVKGPSSGGLGVIEVYVVEKDSKNPIPTSDVEVVDEFGQTYRKTSNNNGYMVFTDLPLDRTYTIRQLSVPAPMNVPTTGAQFRPLTAGTNYAIVTFENERPTKQVTYNFFEYGDPTISIPNVEFTLTDYKGVVTRYKTNPQGLITIPLPIGLYELKQITTDSNHVVYQEPKISLIDDDMQVDIPNKLKNPTVVQRVITITKEWGDAAPQPLPNLTFDVMQNGVKFTSVTMQTSGNSQTITVTVPKYNSNQEKYSYTIQEQALPNYYAVYSKASVDDSAWKVTNYLGEMVGDCSDGNFWVTSIDYAYEFGPDGIYTRRSFSLNKPPYGGPFFQTSGGRSGGAATVIDNGKKLMTINYYQYQGYYEAHIYDVSGENGVEIGRKLKRIIIDLNRYAFSNDLLNSLGTTPDGKYVVAKTIQGPLNFIPVADILNTGNGNVLPFSRVSTLPASSIYSAGDIIFLPNGDMMISTLDGANSYTGNGFAIIPYNSATNSYLTNSVKRFIGGVQWPSGNISDGLRIEGLSMVDGNVYTTVTRLNGASTVARFNRLPSYSDPTNTVYQLTAINNSGNSFGSFTDASSAFATTCNPIVRVVGSKIWNNDQAFANKTRPTSIRVELYRNGLATGITQTVTPDTFGNWTWVFANLPKNDDTGKAFVYSTREVGYTKNGVYYTGVPPGYQVTYPNTNAETNDFSITNTYQPAKFNIKKENEKGQALTGAGFTLYLEDQKTIYQAETLSNSSGLLSFVNLGVGTYYLKETKAPPGYQLNATFYKVTVAINASGKLTVTIDGLGQPSIDGQQISTYKVVNVANKGSFTLRKVDQLGKVIKNNKAIFELRQGSTLIKTIETTNDGEAIIADLPQGEYTLVETKAPTGYIKTFNEYKIVVGESGAVQITLNGEPVSSNPLIIVNAIFDGYPDTGGIGILPYLVLGLGIMLLAFLIRKKSNSEGCDIR